jgi:hypothetical protein
LATVALENFVERNLDATYYWTFTEPRRFGDPPSPCHWVQSERDDFIGPLPRRWTKDEAEAAFKPFRDLVARQGGEMVVIWQKQERGSWHPHIFVNLYFCVSWLRPWMKARGWGPQMYVEKLGGRNGFRDRGLGEVAGLIRYLVRYLARDVTAAGDAHKKCFGCSRSAKAGTVKFKWVPWERAGSYLYAMGKAALEGGARAAWRDVESWTLRRSRAFVEVKLHFSEVMDVIRLGAKVTHWADYDFLWEFGFRSSA